MPRTQSALIGLTITGGDTTAEGATCTGMIVAQPDGWCVMVMDSTTGAIRCVLLNGSTINTPDAARHIRRLVQPE